MTKLAASNWKTTVGGVAIAVGVIATGVGKLLTGDPVNWEEVIAAISLLGVSFGLIAAKDGDK